MKRIIAFVTAALLLFAALGCVKNAAANSTGEQPAPAGAIETQETEETAEPQKTAEQTAEPQKTADPQEESSMKNPIATITMQDGGVMTIELYPDVAPNTVRNFISLANSGFYDGLTFHRIISGFMIQGGDPDGMGSGGPGYAIKGEFTDNGFQNDLKHTRGVISMARTVEPDSAGSQFFIMHEDAPHLDGQYAAFGMMTDGFFVLDRIASTKTNRYDMPLSPVVIESIRVETFGVDYGEPEKVQ